MENATKALLIAAAVLVAILIISLGLVVYNMASETIDSVNFSGQEVTAFNDKFTQYEGKKVRGSEVNAMLRTVLNSNMQSNADGGTPGTGKAKFVTVNVENTTTKASKGDAKAKDGTADLVLKADAVTLNAMEASTSELFDVEVQYDSTTGFVTNIKVSKAK